MLPGGVVPNQELSLGGQQYTKPEDLGQCSWGVVSPLLPPATWRDNNMSVINFAAEVGRRFHGGGNVYQLMSIFGVVDAQRHRMVIDDRVMFTADEPEVRAAIEWFHDIYQKGLIDPEVFTQDNRQHIAKGRSEPTLYGAFMDWHGENIVGTALMYDPATLQRTVYQPLRPLQTDTGKPPLWPTTRRFKLRTRDLAITSANQHPEVTMRWIDTIYDPYWGMHWATSLPGAQWLEEVVRDFPGIGSLMSFR